MKVLVACSIGRDTGAYVRGKYLVNGLIANGCKVDYLNTFKSMPFGLYYLLSIPHNFFRILFKGYDAAIALKPYPNTMYPILFRKLFGKKAIVDIDDLDVGGKSIILKKIMAIVQKPFIRHFDLIIVHNANLYELVSSEIKVPKEKILKIEQGVDLSIFKALSNKDKIREELGIKWKGKLLVYTGHLNVAAHLEEILKAYKLLLEEKDDVKLFIVGGGPEEEKYRKMIKEMWLSERVEVTGHISAQEKIVKYLNVADACVVYYPPLSFNKYRCSMKLREYLAVGVPSVCNNFGDLARFKEYTYNFKSDDFNAFKKMIIKALYNPDGREKKGKEFVRKNMSWSAIAKDICEAIKKC